MKNRLHNFRTLIVVLFAGSAFTAAHATDMQTMTIDTQAPLRATLMPTVSIDADSTTSDSNPARMRIADTAPLQVTLMPTVYVSARANPELATTMLPTVQVTARIESAQTEIESARIVNAENGVLDLPAVETEQSSNDKHSLALRARTMPR